MIHRDFAAVTLTTLPSILGLPNVNNTCAISTTVMDVSDSGIIFPIVSRPSQPIPSLNIEDPAPLQGAAGGSRFRIQDSKNSLLISF